VSIYVYNMYKIDKGVVVVVVVVSALFWIR
jgi:hypothetical protein